jgi:diguanylate cyclase (GGDEF)-like protein
MITTFLKIIILTALIATSTHAFAKTAQQQFYDYVELSMRYFTHEVTEAQFIAAVNASEISRSTLIETKVFNYLVFSHRTELAGKLGVQVVEKITEKDWRALQVADPLLYATEKASYFAVHGKSPLSSLRELKAELISLGDKKSVAQVSAALGQQLSLDNSESISALIEYLYALPELPNYDDSRNGFFYSSEFVLTRVIASFYLMGAYERAHEYVLQLLSSKTSYLDHLHYPEPYFQIVFILTQVGEYEQALGVANQFLDKVETHKLPNSAKLYGLIAKGGVFLTRQEPGDLSTAAEILRGAVINLNSDGVGDKARSLVIKALLSAINGELPEARSAIKDLKQYMQENQQRFSAADFRDTAELEGLVFELLGESDLVNQAASGKFEFENQLMVKSLSTALNNLANYLQRDIELLVLEAFEAKYEKQALQLEAQNLRMIIFSLIILVLTISIAWLWQRQRVTKKLADTDTLTGALNRRAIYEWVDKIMPQSTSMCICLIDLDYFKKINDKYGHLAGDEVLATFSRIVCARIRKTDRLCRFGGEEFLLVLDDITEKQAHALIDDIRVSLETNIKWQTSASSFSVSFSAGIILLTGKAELDAVISQCDNLLYHAKINGRARTESAVFCETQSLRLVS